MPESRINIGLAELTKNIVIWLAVLSQRRPSLLRDLWTRRGESHDGPKIEHARHEMARYLAAKLLYGHELTRPSLPQDQFRGEYTPNGRTGPE